MPCEPFRFLHASDLRLDESPSGTGPLDGATRIVAEDASLTALENVVEACLEHDVEFVLFTGVTFGSGQPTLRARRALLTAFENLREFEIQVFWEVRREQLVAAFTDTAEIPDNVTTLHPGDGEPVAVVRQGRVIASISAAVFDPSLPAGDGRQGERDERGAFRIGLAGPVEELGEFKRSPSAVRPVQCSGPFDYLSVSTSGRRTTDRTQADVAHDRGPVQGLHSDETGSHGATLVHVDPERAAELTFLPAAPLRWERILVGVDRGSTCEQIARRMQSALLELEPAAVERLWIVHWQVIGNGDLFESLKSGQAVEELFDLVNRGLLAGSRIERLDRIGCRRRLAADADELIRQICEWIEQADASPVEELVQELHDPGGPAWVTAVEEALPRVDLSAARDSATRVTQELLLHSAQIETQPEQDGK